MAHTAKYFIRVTIDENGREPEVRDCSGRYATLREAREALKRFTVGLDADTTFRFSRDKNTLFRCFGDDTRMIHSILNIKLLQK